MTVNGFKQRLILFWILLVGESIVLWNLAQMQAAVQGGNNIEYEFLESRSSKYKGSESFYMSGRIGSEVFEVDIFEEQYEAIYYGFRPLVYQVFNSDRVFSFHEMWQLVIVAGVLGTVLIIFFLFGILLNLDIVRRSSINKGLCYIFFTVLLMYTVFLTVWRFNSSAGAQICLKQESEGSSVLTFNSNNELITGKTMSYASRVPCDELNGVVIYPDIFSFNNVLIDVMPTNYIIVGKHENSALIIGSVVLKDPKKDSSSFDQNFSIEVKTKEKTRFFNFSGRDYYLVIDRTDEPKLVFRSDGYITKAVTLLSLSETESEIFKLDVGAIEGDDWIESEMDLRQLEVSQ